MPGLEPGIHLASKQVFQNGWIAGSTPATTTLIFGYMLAATVVADGFKSGGVATA